MENSTKQTDEAIKVFMRIRPTNRNHNHISKQIISYDNYQTTNNKIKQINFNDQ